MDPYAPDMPSLPAVLLDEALQPRWWMATDEGLSDLRVGPDGHLWAFDQTSTGPVYPRVMGDADLLRGGHVLADFGYVERDESGVDYDVLGLGRTGVRLVEFDPEQPDEPALDLRLVSEATTAPEGWALYRARKIPALR